MLGLEDRRRDEEGRRDLVRPGAQGHVRDVQDPASLEIARIGGEQALDHRDGAPGAAGQLMHAAAADGEEARLGVVVREAVLLLADPEQRYRAAGAHEREVARGRFRIQGACVLLEPAELLGRGLAPAGLEHLDRTEYPGLQLCGGSLGRDHVLLVHLDALVVEEPVEPRVGRIRDLSEPGDHRERRLRLDGLRRRPRLRDRERPAQRRAGDEHDKTRQREAAPLHCEASPRIRTVHRLTGHRWTCLVTAFFGIGAGRLRRVAERPRPTTASIAASAPIGTKMSSRFCDSGEDRRPQNPSSLPP